MRIPEWFQLERQHPMVIPDAPHDEPDHIHQWIERKKTYAAPRRELAGLQERVSSTHLMQAALLGITTYLYECGLCHETRTEELVGSDQVQLDDLLDSVQLYGPQYRQRDGITFVIQRYQQPSSSLPLR